MTVAPVALAPADLLSSLKWRYAVKKFDPTRKVPTNIWESLEEALILTPSSFGLQPWRFIVITDQAVKDKLVPVSWGQKQVADASHVVVFAIRKDLNTVDIGRYLGRMAEVQKIPLSALDGFKKMLLGFVAGSPAKFDINQWATHQVYIALGNFMTSAAVLGIDTCPMEGLEPSKYDDILGLAQEGYATAVVAVAGYRASDDKYAASPKVRYLKEDVFKHI